MLKAGLTGGIGSGKSTVARIFEVLGIPVYYADTAARRLMQEHEGLKAAIIQTFGADIYPNGKLDRARLSAAVFGDQGQVEKLNALVHPYTLRDAAEWMQQQVAPYTIKEAALIFESGSDKDLDLVIGVSAPEELRIQRVIRRDGTTREAVAARMKHQLNETEKMNRCDFVLLNDEQSLLIPQVLHLHQTLLDRLNRTR